MATIKVPYTYTEYSFSPKATKLSKRMASKKHETGIVTGMISFVVIAAPCINIPAIRNITAFTFVFLALCLAAAVFCGIYAEKFRNKLYKKMILKALEKDLNTLYPVDGDYVKEQMARLKEQLYSTENAHGK